jgi:transcription factor WhiB
MVLRLRYKAPDNWVNAKCLMFRVTRDADPFFDEEDPTDALEFCNGTADGVICPIRHECLMFSLTNNCKEGVWGGTSELTRKAIRKKWPLQRGKVPRPEWQWMPLSQALEGISLTDLLLEPDED